jgi:hypothetical protein
MLSEPSAGTSLKARLPAEPADGRALMLLLESLSLWYGLPLHAVSAEAVVSSKGTDTPTAIRSLASRSHFFEESRVDEILRARRCPLVEDEVVEGDHLETHTIEIGEDSVFEERASFDAINRPHQIDAQRGLTKKDHVAVPHAGNGSHYIGWGTKTSRGPGRARKVVSGAFKDQIDVFGRSRAAVKCHRVAANEQEFNRVASELLQQFFEVGG